jgi:SAM-dependent methyltransferase
VAEGQFDVITLIHALEHFEEPYAVLRKVRELLKDDGLLLIQLPAHRSPLLWKGYLKEGVERTLLRYYGPTGHVYGFTPRAIKHLLAFAGFETQYFEAGRYGHRYRYLARAAPRPVRPLVALGLAVIDAAASAFGVGGMTMVCRKGGVGHA